MCNQDPWQDVPVEMAVDCPVKVGSHTLRPGSGIRIKYVEKCFNQAA